MIIKVTTVQPHKLTTGDTVTMTGWNVTAINGTFVITVVSAYVFTYVVTGVTAGVATGGTLRVINDVTLSFQFEKMFWVSFHKYIPDRYSWNSNGLYRFNEGNIYKFFTGNYGYLSDNEEYIATVVDFIFNDNKAERFLLKSVKWTTNIENDDINYWDETINKLLIYSKNLCTEEITLTKKVYGYNTTTNVMENVGNTLFKDGEWIYNDIKDYLTTPNSLVLDPNFDLVTNSLNLNKNWFEKSKFISKFVITRLIFTNTNANKKLRISNIAIDAKNIL